VPATLFSVAVAENIGLSKEVNVSVYVPAVNVLSPQVDLSSPALPVLPLVPAPFLVTQKTPSPPPSPL
jgi:hypothetical protein